MSKNVNNSQMASNVHSGEDTSIQRLRSAEVVVAGGYGMQSKENFAMLHQIATLLSGEVGATRAATDAGFEDNNRMIGQTGLRVAPKLYIACGLSGVIQHRSGIDPSATIISINSDPDAPINSVADYVIVGDVMDVLPRMISCLKDLSGWRDND